MGRGCKVALQWTRATIMGHITRKDIMFNPVSYRRQHPKLRQRVKFVVCYPSTRTAVAAFDTLKAARHHAENMIIEGFPWDFPARTAIPIISRETIEKYNQRAALDIV